MPRTPNTVSFFPFLFALADCNDSADDFVAGDARERCAFAKGTLLQEGVGVADAAGVDFD
jgi:hypothetical protein